MNDPYFGRCDSWQTWWKLAAGWCGVESKISELISGAVLSLIMISRRGPSAVIRMLLSRERSRGCIGVLKVRGCLSEPSKETPGRVTCVDLKLIY